MNINDYNYELPERFIAQTPLQNRSESKLLVMDKLTGEIEHNRFLCAKITTHFYYGEYNEKNSTFSSYYNCIPYFMRTVHLSRRYTSGSPCLPFPIGKYHF